MEKQSGHASATPVFFSNATNLRSVVIGTLLVTILLCAAGSLSGQESRLRVNQGNGLPGVELAPRNLVPSLRRWLPADVDEAVPAVAPDVACSLPEVLQGAGQRAKELVANLERFTATERVEHSELGRGGNWRPALARSFHYVVSISEIRPGMLNVEETRDGSASLDAFPTALATTGLPAFALVFHPYYVADFDMMCEGLGEWRGQPAWQVHFQQRPDKPARMHSFFIGGHGFPVKQRGRAWISVDGYQILHLVLDSVEPLPEIRLKTEHHEIEYRPVEFRNRRARLWLPESGDVYMDFRGHRYHHRHSFSDFLLFAVDVDQTIHAPPEP